MRDLVSRAPDRIVYPKAWLGSTLRCAILGVGLALPAGCDESTPPSCTPGDALPCMGPAGCSGLSVCDLVGKEYGSCVCDAPAATTTDAGTEGARCTPGAVRPCLGTDACVGQQSCLAPGDGFAECRCSASEPEPERPDLLGARCLTDADCGSNLNCWAESSEGRFGVLGGPSGGYCTAGCTTTSDCIGVDEYSICLQFAMNTLGVCFASCISEYPAPGEVKCLGRSDLACWSGAELFGLPEDPSVRERGLCLPKCDADEQCPGRYCSRSYRLATCRDQPSDITGGAIGDACTVAEDCAGRVCRQLPGGAATCSATCTIGSPSSCGFGASASTREAACLLPFEWSGGTSYGPGDVGLCAELCDDDADCTQPGFRCEPSFDAAGRTGTCVFSSDASLDAGASDSSAP